MNLLLKRLLISSLLSFATMSSAWAQANYVTDANFTAQAAGNGTYNYTIQLNNEASSGSQVGFFWFAWVPSGQDLLPSAPTVTGMPANWYSAVAGGTSYYNPYPDGYSIEFYVYGTPGLQPGQSATFEFNSPDAPSALTSNSPYFGAPAGTSYVYADYTMYDVGAAVTVTPAPEPSSTILLTAGALALCLATWRRSQKRAAAL
jgi:hypothetical protein